MSGLDNRSHWATTLIVNGEELRSVVLTELQIDLVTTLIDELTGAQS